MDHINNYFKQLTNEYESKAAFTLKNPIKKEEESQVQKLIRRLL